MKQNIMFEYEANQSYNLGDVFYTIERCSRPVMTDKCPVCHGEKHIQVNGYTIECSYCKSDRFAQRYDYIHYIVKRWRIAGVTVQDNDDSWKVDPRRRRIKFSLLRKVGHGNASWSSTSERRDITPHDLDDEIYTTGEEYMHAYSCNHRYFRSPYYTDYKTAVRICEELNDLMRKAAEEYSTEHGVNIEEPKWNSGEMNDPK